MKFLLFCLLVMISAAAKAKPNGHARIDRQLKTRKAKCEIEECGHMVPEESYNCVNKCTSSKCFEEIYASNPLEDGEIDYDRERRFTSCLRKEPLEKVSIN
jgi:hypothetical protein